MAHQTSIPGWGTDKFFFTEAARGGPLTWAIGDAGFDGDVLGPTRHAHDGAAEYFFMAEGAVRVEVGGDEFVVQEGDLCCIPADVPHNVLGPTSRIDAHLFCVVAPNFVDHKWRIDGFTEEGELGKATVGRPFVDAELPKSGGLSAEALTLKPTDEVRLETLQGRECVYFVCEGKLDLEFSNGLSGSLAPGAFQHVREGSPHKVSTASDECRVLRIDCAFESWATAVRS
ncbi:cupin domain-containing protein [Aeromicrobium sp.]|uniref:cupin domain-containing protein n=1 Tax=Aeromicrobium sp. TaxID=1871063 RepID=UPI002FCAF236